MSKRMLWLIIFVIILIIIILILNKPKDEIIQNEASEQILTSTNVTLEETISEKVIINEEKNFGNYIFSNTEIIAKNERTEFKTYVKNISGNSTDNKEVKVILYNKNGATLGSFELVIPNLKDNEERVVTTECLYKCERMSDYEIYFEK